PAAARRGTDRARACAATRAPPEILFEFEQHVRAYRVIPIRTTSVGWAGARTPLAQRRGDARLAGAARGLGAARPRDRTAAPTRRRTLAHPVRGAGPARRRARRPDPDDRTGRLPGQLQERAHLPGEQTRTGGAGPPRSLPHRCARGDRGADP